MNEEQKIAGIKLGAVGLAGLAGMTLNDLVAVVTIIFILLQIGLLIPKYWRLLVSAWQRWRS